MQPVIRFRVLSWPKLQTIQQSPPTRKTRLRNYHGVDYRRLRLGSSLSLESSRGSNLTGPTEPTSAAASAMRVRGWWERSYRLRRRRGGRLRRAQSQVSIQWRRLSARPAAQWSWSTHCGYSRVGPKHDGCCGARACPRCRQGISEFARESRCVHGRERPVDSPTQASRSCRDRACEGVAAWGSHTRGRYRCVRPDRVRGPAERHHVADQGSRCRGVGDSSHPSCVWHRERGPGGRLCALVLAGTQEALRRPLRYPRRNGYDQSRLGGVGWGSAEGIGVPDA
jgi:hypothetical protein